jgi:DNA-binding NarL/FixJ family response regulator
MVDDVQWLDPASAAFLEQFVVRGAGRVVLTARSGEGLADPLVSLWKDREVERFELQPLGRLDVDTLIRHVLERPVTDVTAKRLWQLSEGNVLFLRELVLGALETNALDLDDGVYRLSRDLEPTNRLATIIGDRLRRLDADARNVVEHLAVGEPLLLDVLSAVCSVDGIIAAERAGLAVATDADTIEYRLAHPLYGEVIRKTLSTPESHKVMARLADEMTPRIAESPSQVLRVAMWRIDSETDADPTLLTDAARFAGGLGEHRLAERLARVACVRGGGFRSSLALGDALNRAGRPAEGDAILSTLVPDARTDRDVVDLAVARYYGKTVSTGFQREAENVLVEAESRVSDPQLRGFLRAQRATLLAFAGHFDEAFALAGTADRSSSDEASALRAIPALGSAWIACGKPETAVSFAERMLPVALRRQPDLPQAPFWVVSVQVVALIAAGRLDDADTEIDLIEGLTKGAAPADPISRFLALGRGMIALHRGQVRTARRLLRESSVEPAHALALTNLVEACALVGDEEGAAAALEEAEHQASRAPIFAGMTRRARSWAAYARGEISRAHEHALEAAAWSHEHGHQTAEMFSLHDAIRFGAGPAPARRLVELARAQEGRWAGAIGAHAEAHATGDAASLDEAAQQFEQMGAILLAAEVAAQAALAHSATGLPARSERSRARSQSLAAECEDARSPALEALAEPPSLTTREREIAHLATQGLTAAAIAERLYVSTRTVEGHLHRIYTKLGVNSRHGLHLALKRSAQHSS